MMEKHNIKDNEINEWKQCCEDNIDEVVIEYFEHSMKQPESFKI